MEYLVTSGWLSTLLVLMGVCLAIGSILYLCAVMSNGDAQGRNWPPADCTSPTRADRKTGFTRE
jgi:hypothetical protein